MELLWTNVQPQAVSVDGTYIMFTFCSDLTVQFNSETYTVLESIGNVTLTLKTDKPFEYPFTIDVSTAEGTAVGEHTHCVNASWSEESWLDRGGQE